jgi:sugar/nucleoside kinase (ribokinase family)
MPDAKAKIVVAGHICLDIIPDMSQTAGGLAGVMTPGKLVNVGRAIVATGGTVSNAGLALHRLGVRTRLMGKVGDDLFGRAVLGLLSGHDASLAEGMIVAAGESTSYTVVLSPPGVDRVFLHCPGANDTFCADDVDYAALDGAGLFHFGYPPLMRRMYADGGVELARLLARVKGRGLTTSLDLARPDPHSPAGQVDWVEILKRVLPHVDIFLPSVEEILFMLDRARYDQLERQAGGDGLISLVDGALLAELGRRILEMGSAVAVLKLGDRGLYARTTGDESRLAAMGARGPGAGWRGRELLSPCFQVRVVGTTGSGDCTIAGFLAALVDGLPLETVMTTAVAVGACNVEAADATSGVPHLSRVRARMESDWPRLKKNLSLPGWAWDPAGGVFVGPGDGK